MPFLGQLRNRVRVDRITARSYDPANLSHADTFATAIDSIRCNQVEQLEREEDLPTGKRPSQEYLVHFQSGSDIRTSDRLIELDAGGDTAGETLRVLEVRKVRGSVQARCVRVLDG